MNAWRELHCSILIEPAAMSAGSSETVVVGSMARGLVELFDTDGSGILAEWPA